MIDPHNNLQAKEALKGIIKTILIGLVLTCCLLQFCIQLAKKEAEEQEQPKQDTTISVNPPIDSTFLINNNNVNFDLERIGERKTMERMRKHKIDLLEERLNKETEIK